MREQPTDQKQRIAWIDVARCLACIAVISYHVVYISSDFYTEKRFFDELTLIAAVPFFFFVSGYFTKTKSSIKSFLERILTMLVALAAWNSVYLIIQGGSLTVSSLIGIPNGSGMANNQLWFLKDLLLLTIALPIITRLNASFRLGLAIVLLLVTLPKEISMFGLIPGFDGSGWFILGTLAKEKNIAAIAEKHARFLMPLSFALLPVLIIRAGIVAYKGKFVFPSAYTSAVGILLFAGLAMIICQYAPTIAKLLKHVAPRCFFIYAGQAVAQHFYPEMLSSNFLIWFSPIIIFSVGAVVYEILLKFFPYALLVFGFQKWDNLNGRRNLP